MPGRVNSSAVGGIRTAWSILPRPTPVCHHNCDGRGGGHRDDVINLRSSGRIPILTASNLIVRASGRAHLSFERRALNSWGGGGSLFLSHIGAREHPGSFDRWYARKIENFIYSSFQFILDRSFAELWRNFCRIVCRLKFNLTNSSDLLAFDGIL